MLKRQAGWILALVAATAFGQGYPNRPVRVVVAAATGGPDIVARVVSAQLQAQLGQPFVVENRPGANGIVGADVVAKAAPDGYTLLVYSSGFVINPFIHKSLPYDTEKDFTPVTNLVSNGGLFFAAHPSVPAQSLQEFIALAKKPNAKFAYSTPGVGNTWHLAMEVFKTQTGTHLTHIPYKGGGPAAAALVAGEVQAMFTSPAPIMPHYKNGRVRVLERDYKRYVGAQIGIYNPSGEKVGAVSHLRNTEMLFVVTPRLRVGTATVRERKRPAAPRVRIRRVVQVSAP